MCLAASPGADRLTAANPWGILKATGPGRFPGKSSAVGKWRRNGAYHHDETSTGSASGRTGFAVSERTAAGGGRQRGPGACRRDHRHHPAAAQRCDQRGVCCSYHGRGSAAFEYVRRVGAPHCGPARDPPRGRGAPGEGTHRADDRHQLEPVDAAVCAQNKENHLGHEPGPLCHSGKRPACHGNGRGSDCAHRKPGQRGEQ